MRSFDDFFLFCNSPVLLVQDHSKEDKNNLLRVCNTFNKYTFSLFNQVSHCDGELRNIYNTIHSVSTVQVTKVQCRGNLSNQIK